ncbi:hypothetical protein EG827_13595 [bacterium]|nr:hypothetical protein [bacterium]
MSQLTGDKVFKLEKHINVLFVGDSHPETAFDPQRIEGSDSIAKSGENYFYTYYKLRHFLEMNHQVRTIVLGHSYHNIANKYQESFLTGDKASASEAYFRLLDEEGRKSLCQQGSGYLVNILKYQYGIPLQFYRNSIVQKMMMGRALRRADISFYGGYNSIDRSNLEQRLIEQKVSSYFYDSDGNYTGTSPVMVEYLNNIAELCFQRGIRLYLVNLPLHQDYRKRVPAAAIADFTDVSASLGRKFPQITLIDWSRLNLEDRMYYDGDHVNAHGAATVSRMMALELGR